MSVGGECEIKVPTGTSEHVVKGHPGYCHLELLNRFARDLADIIGHRFDAVAANSSVSAVVVVPLRVTSASNFLALAMDKEAVGEKVRVPDKAG